MDRLTHFKTKNGFQKEVVRLMVRVSDDHEEVKRLGNVFFYLDYYNNGNISQTELTAFFEEIGERKEGPEIECIIKSLFLRTPGIISYTEFIAATIHREFYTDDYILAEVFKRIDIDSSGRISCQNIKSYFSRCGVNLDGQVVDQFEKDFDLKNEGTIDFGDFKKVMGEVSENNNDCRECV